MVQIVALPGALAHAGEYGIAAVLRRDVADQLLDEDGFSYAGTAEQTDLTTLLIRAEQVNNLDAGFQHLGGGSLFLKIRRFPVDRQILHIRRRFFVVDRLTDDVKDTPERLLSYRYRDRRSGGDRLHPAHQTVRRSHRDALYGVVTQMLGNLHHKRAAIRRRNMNRIVYARKLSFRKLNVKYRTDNLSDFAFYLF